MTDYFAQIHGVLPNGRSWSTGRHITSSQTEGGLLTTWGNAWSAAWAVSGTGLATLFSSGLTLTGYTVATLDATMRELTKSSSTVSAAGVATGTSLPSNCSIVIDWRSSSLKRSARGRQALPPPADTQVGNDLLLSTPANNVKTALLAVQSAIQSDGSSFFVYNRHPLIDGTPAYHKTVLTSLVVRTKIGSQRKRYRKEVAVYV